MKSKILTTAALLVTANLIISVPVLAQDPPARTYQPGFWQPVARVNINRPIAIKLINQTEVVLEYSLTANEAPPRQLLPRNTAVLREIPLPAYVLINPTSSNLDSSRVYLKYEVAVGNDNVVTVKIRQISGDIPGNTTLNIQENGAIYLY